MRRPPTHPPIYTASFQSSEDARSPDSRSTGDDSDSESDEDWLKLPDVYFMAGYENFKYRVWFIRYVIETVEITITSLRQQLWWRAMVEGTDVNGDLWLWAEGDSDEAYIKSRFEKIYPTLGFDAIDWANACRALGVRHARTASPAARSSSLAHLTAETRLRIIGWFIITAVIDKGEDIESLITKWASVTHIVTSNRTGEGCQFCGISHLLPIWVDTMLEVYLLEDLWSFSGRNYCQCLQR
ncbi:hypothetical protein B0H11DRAFT_1352968 [Mycena galericulata]|nr:hypothetical protein B0H11DRAFT_1352968 [Mycena galericulata]